VALQDEYYESEMVVQKISELDSVAHDHFSYDHSSIPARVPKAKVVSRSTARDHFSYTASAFEESINVSEYDHSEIRARVTRSARRAQSTASDHFSYAGSSFDEEYTNELDHSQIRQREACSFHPRSTSADHFSYCGSCPDVEINQYDHFHYTQPLAAH
jgi:hypothetical protein